MSGDEETSLQELYTKAANAKRALTRAKKELQNALKALTEAASSQHFFEELVKTQKDYREKRKKVYAIYDAIEDQVSDEKFKHDFGKQCNDIEKDFDVLEEQARTTIATHHNAVIAITSNISQARAANSGGGGGGGGGAGGGGGGAARWRIEASFEPKPRLSLEMNAEETQNWERQFTAYFEISNLKNADIGTQRAVLINCLQLDLQVQIYEAISGMTDIKDGLALVKEEIKKRHPRVLRRHHLFSLEQKKDEYSFSTTVARMDSLAKDAELTDMSKDAILCHLMLRACQDDQLRTKLLEVDEDKMTVVLFKEIIQKFETIQLTNKGLNKKEMVRKVGAGERRRCFVCQVYTSQHDAATCPVDPKSLFCQKCSDAGHPAPHSHNTYATCRGRGPPKKDKEDDKSDKSKDKDKDKAASKRIHVRGLSPAGEPESSEEEEIVQARRVRVQDHSPAGSSISEGEDESTGSASSFSEESDLGKEFAGNMVQEIRMGRYGIMKTSERQ